MLSTAVSTRGVAGHSRADRPFRLPSAGGEVRLNAVGRHELERFRYQIYIKEQRKPLPWADHARERLPDPFDGSGHHFTYHCGTDLLGCSRLHVHEEVPLEALHRLNLAGFAARYDGQFGYVSKLMVARTRRGVGVPYELMKAMVEVGSSDPWRIEIAFFNCHPKLVPLYERTGFRRFGATFEDPHVGAQVPMHIICGDVDHFRHCGSVLTATASRFRIHPERKRALLALIPPVCQAE